MNDAVEETLLERDDIGRSYSSIVRDAMQAIGAMCESSRELMAYYEKDIRTTKMEDLNGAIHARFVSNEAKFLNPQLSLECSRDIPANRFTGARTVYHAEIASAQKFLLGVCREHYNDHGVEVYVTEAPKTAAETLWNPGAFINVAIVNTSIIMKPMLVVVTNTRKKIYRGNVTQSRVSAMPYRFDKSVKNPETVDTEYALARIEQKNRNQPPARGPARGSAIEKSAVPSQSTQSSGSSIVNAIASVFSPQPPSAASSKTSMTVPLKLERTEDSPNVIIVNTNPDNTVVNSGNSTDDHVHVHGHEHERKRLLPPVTPAKTNTIDENEDNKK